MIIHIFRPWDDAERVDYELAREFKKAGWVRGWPKPFRHWWQRLGVHRY